MTRAKPAAVPSLLTKSLIDATAAPPTGRVVLWDDPQRGVPGFGCLILASGARSFVFRYRAGRGRAGTQRQLTLGSFGTLTVGTARSAARKRYEAVRAGDDPLGAERERAAVPTVAEAFASWLVFRQASTKKRGAASASTLKEYARLWDSKSARGANHFIGRLRVTEVRRSHIEAMHESITARAPYVANRTVNMLSAFFTFCEVRELRPQHTSPCRGVDLNEETKRRGSLAPDQYAILGASLAQLASTGLVPAPRRQRKRAEGATAKQSPRKVLGGIPNPRAAAIFRFLAMTGWRSEEAKSLRWDALSRTDGRAVLVNTKSGRSMRPLGPAVFALLDALPGERGEYVFPGRDPSRPIADVKHTWASVTQALGLSLVVHSLRHSFTTQARRLGYGNHIIAPLIGHVTAGSMTANYGDIPDELVAEAAARVSASIACMLGIESHEHTAADATRILPFRAVGATAAGAL